uniref:Uncharacterized protein n=1 Tax=Trichuris muris TaxID=70415 RepID=A0A5S6R0V3_TRIMR
MRATGDPPNGRLEVESCKAKLGADGKRWIARAFRTLTQMQRRDSKSPSGVQDEPLLTRSSSANNSESLTRRVAVCRPFLSSYAKEYPSDRQSTEMEPPQGVRSSFLANKYTEPFRLRRCRAFIQRSVTHSAHGASQRAAEVGRRKSMKSVAARARRHRRRTRAVGRSVGDDARSLAPRLVVRRAPSIGR